MRFKAVSVIASLSLSGGTLIGVVFFFAHSADLSLRLPAAIFFFVVINLFDNELLFYKGIFKALA